MFLPDPTGSRDSGEASGVNLLWMQFLLRDGETYTPDERDVTGRFERTGNSGTIRLKLNIGSGLWGADDNPVDLPYAESEGGMIDAGVNAWGENQIIEY
jgi:hypothetical protein